MTAVSGFFSLLFESLPATLPLLGLLAVAALAAVGWGRAATGPLVDAEPAERVALQLAVGLAGVGMALFALGLCGGLGAVAVGVIGAGGIALFLRHLRIVRVDGFAVAVPLGLAVWLGTLLAYPLTGWDPAMYRLPTARAFAESGGLPFVPELRFPVGPQLGEVLFAGALAVSDDHLARGLVFLAQLGTAALAFGWASRRHGMGAGLVAAALFWGSPGVVLYGTDAYVDVLQALFTAAALAAVDLARTRSDHRLFFLAGALAGAGAATRYTGLLAAVAVPLVLLALEPRETRRRTFLLATAGALLTAVPFYLRAALLTGNPLFPLLPAVFGPNEWELGALAKIYGSEGLGAFLLRLVLRPDSGPPIGNPWFLAGLPLALLGAWRDARSRLPVGFAVALVAGTWATAPDPRFVLPALAPLALGAAAGLATLPAWRGRGRFQVAGLALALATPGLLYAGYRLVQLGPLPRGDEAVAAFLARQVPGHPLVAELERWPGARLTVYAYGGERLRFYSRHRWLGDFSGPYRWRLIEPELDDPPALANILRGFGAEYFVWVRVGRPEPAWLATGTPDLVRVFADPSGAVYRVSEPADQASAIAPATSSRISGVE